jgi:hypothetical protein
MPRTADTDSVRVQPDVKLREYSRNGAFFKLNGKDDSEFEVPTAFAGDQL